MLVINEKNKVSKRTRDYFVNNGLNKNDPKNNPEEYKDLIVRVAGYSDHFRNLSKALQDEIIERTEQSFN